jgi:predicted DNA-binding protein (MmcQ/YjbR family)
MDTEMLRDYCMSLPGTTEDVKWGDHMCFSVGGKLYCIAGFEDTSNVSLKVTDEEFESLTLRTGIIQAPYMARNKWVCMTSRGALSRAEWQRLLRQSYELVLAKLPKKTRMAIAAGAVQ